MLFWKVEKSGLWQAESVCLCLKVFLCDCIVTCSLMICVRGGIEDLIWTCHSEGAALSSWYSCYRKVNVTHIVYCLRLKYMLHMVVQKCKVCCIEFVPKKRWIHWGMLNSIVTCLWKLNVWYLKAVEMVRVCVIILTLCIYLTFLKGHCLNLFLYIDICICS